MATTSKEGAWFLKNRCPISPHTNNRTFGEVDCRNNTKRRSTNQLCCVGVCTSPWRMCKRCQDEGLPYSASTRAIDALLGLCARHGGVVRTPAELLQFLSSGDLLPLWPPEPPRPETAGDGLRRDYFSPPSVTRATVETYIVRSHLSPKAPPPPPANTRAPAADERAARSLTAHEREVIRAAQAMKMPVDQMVRMFPGKVEAITAFLDTIRPAP